MINPYGCGCEGSCDFCTAPIYTRKNLETAWTDGAYDVYAKAAKFTDDQGADSPLCVIDWEMFEEALLDAQVIVDEEDE